MVEDSRRPVVVAVGGSGSGRAAIQLAATEAGYRQAPLIAVTAYQAGALGAPAARPVATLRTPGEDRETAESILGDEVAAALGDDAEQAQLRAMPGLPGRKLVETARATNAQMIVLASGISGSALAGAVSQYVLRNAPCPVLVVPDRPVL